MVSSYTALLEKSANSLPDLPGCAAAGDTLEETKSLIAETIKSHLEILANDQGMLRPVQHRDR